MSPLKKDKFMNSSAQSILMNLLILVVGFVLGNQLHQYKMVLQIPYIIISIVLLGILLMLYYSYQFSRLMMNAKVKKKKLTYWYWAILLFCFAVYYISQYDNFQATYQANKFGINQEQYIFIVNSALFLVFGAVLHVIVFQQYSIKNISKDGIELEKPVEVMVLENNNHIISKISEQLGALDEVVNELYIRGYVTTDLSFKEYANLLERVLSPIAYGYEKVYIQVFGEKEYENFMIKEKGYPTGMVKKTLYNFAECGIIPVEDGIHIKYKLTGIQKFREKEVYIIIQLGTLFDLKIGELIYGYIKCFEAIYFKYVDD